MSFPNKQQRATLEILLNQYENSKSYTGDNVRKQSFSVVPEKLCPNYHDSFVDLTVIEEFERDMEELERKGLVKQIVRDSEIAKIVAVTEQIPVYYKLLEREEKRELIKLEEELYRGYLGQNSVLDSFCERQLSKLSKGNKAEYPIDRASELLRLGAFILENQEEYLERELSIRFFGDSKKFERSYRRAVCKMLERNGDYSEKLFGVLDEREKEQIILGEYNIYANPSYVYLRGHAELVLESGHILCLTDECPIALSSQAIERVSRFRMKKEKAMTVENLTSFHRLQDDGFFYIFLSGYHNTLKQRLIKKLAEENPNVEWYHFGDLDPDGFLILEHLKRGTGLSFTPFHMGVEELLRFQIFGKRLEDNDRRKAENLLERGIYRDELLYMLREDVKLEQEIISLNVEYRDRQKNLKG